MELFQKLSRTTTLLFSCGTMLDFTDFQHSHVVSKYWVTDSFSFSILSYSRFRALKARGTQVTFFFKGLFVYFIIYLRFLFHCCTRTFSFVSYSLVAVRELLISVAPLVAEHGFQVLRLQQLQRMSSAVATHRLSCSMACGIFPDQALNQCPLRCKWILNHWTTKEAPSNIF